MDFNTDLNDRERKRFSVMFRDVEKYAGQAAAALDKGDDAEFLTSFLVLTLSASSLKEVQEVLMESTKSMKENLSDEFPSHIGK